MMKYCPPIMNFILKLALYSFIFIFLLQLLLQPLFAYRPFLTEDAPTTPKGKVGIELGVDAKEPCGDIDAGAVVYMGVCDSAEIYLEVPTALKSNTPDVAGKVDIFNLGGKWNFYKTGEEQILTLAANISNLPKESSLWEYSGALVFTKSLLSEFNLYANFGGNFSSEKFESYIWGIGADKKLSDKLTLVSEVHSGYTLFDKAFTDNHVTAMAGFSISLSEKALLDLAVRLPLTDAAKALDDNGEPTEKIHYVAGLTYEF